jgi:hypothetical protein
MNKKTFKTRSFLSIGTFLFFILLASAGIVIYITDHQPYTFLKIFAMTAHNISAAGFLIFVTVHIFKNWKAIKSYMSGTASGTAKKIVSREMLIVVILLIIILALCWIKAVSTANEHGIEIGF